MAKKIQMRRGPEANLPQLNVAEVGFTTDTKKTFIGSSTGNVELTKKSDVDAKFATTDQTLTTHATQLALKATKTELDAKVAQVISGSPKAIYPTLAELQTAHPTGTTGVYVVTENGNWYYWNNSAWVSGGVYQAASFTDDFLFNALGIPNPQPNKLMKNEIVNGDFSAGTSSFGVPAGTATATNKVLSLKGNGSATYPQISQITTMPYVNGSKFYFKAKCRVTNPDALSINFMLYNAGMGTIITPIKMNPVNGVYYTDSKIITATAGGAPGSIFNVYISNVYATAALSLDKVLEIENFIVLDLTRIFGAGNEPTNTQMDAYLAYYSPNSWFDGTKTIAMAGYSNDKVLAEVNGVVKMASINELTTSAKMPITDTKNYFSTDNVEGALEQNAERVIAIATPLNNSFITGDTYSNIQDLIPVASPTWGYTTSTFSGWGGAIGKPTNFNTLVFKVRNRATNSLPVTSIRAGVTVQNKDGQVIADKTVTNLNILPGEEKLVYLDLGVTVANSELNNLWAMFKCNQIIDVWTGASPYMLSEPNYGMTAYSISGALTPLASSSNVTSASNAKPLLYTVFSQVTLIPKPSFLANIPNTAQAPQTLMLEPVRVIVPDSYHAVVGDTLQIFFRGIIEAVDPYQYDIKLMYSGQNGKNFPRYFQITPLLSDVGTHTLTISVLSNNGVVLGTASTKIIVKAVGASPTAPKNILCIGDSLTSAGFWVREAERRIRATDGAPVGDGRTNFNFIGTVSNAATPSVKWEGYGGWTWNSYLAEPSATTLDMWVYDTHDKTIVDQHSLWTDASNNVWKLETIETTRIKFTRHLAHTGVMPTGAGTLTHSSGATNISAITYTSTVAGGGNPFWNETTNQVDFSDYCSRNGFTGIDYVYTLLTWNGGGSYRETAEKNASHITSAKLFIDKLHAQFPDAKIKVMGIQLPSLNGGMGTNYGASGGYADNYGNVRTVFGMNLAYQALSEDPLYKDYVDFINISGQFDSENNMPSALAPVNTRSTKTELLGNNGVHPDANGYNQIGDGAYRNMIAEITV